MLLMIGAPGRAAAGGLDFDLLGARAIGRAGTSTVSGDGGAALVVNPAGLARSTRLRLQLGVAVHDDDAVFRAADSEESGSPSVSDRSSPVLAPSGSVHGAIGSIVVGAALLELGHLERRYPAPAFNQRSNDVTRLFPHRYGGLELSYRRRVVVVGAAMRVGDWLGLGLSAGGGAVELRERRRIWAGFAGRDELAHASRDLDLAIEGSDDIVPFAAAGLLVAPPALPFELAAALSWSDDAFLRGAHAVTSTLTVEHPKPIAFDEPRAEARLAMPTVLRAGVRYLGERFVVEVGAEHTWFRAAGRVPVWQTEGSAVCDEVDLDESMCSGRIERVPSLAAQRNHSSVRGAVDVEVVPGLLWLIGGYAYATRATSRSRVSPGFGDLGGHTVSVGAESTWNQVSFTLGIARRMSPSIVVTAAESAVDTGNPFEGPGQNASAGAGRHRRTHDTVGLTVEVSWE